MTLRDAWEAEARNWVAWARAPGHDSYWQFHRDRFLGLLPAPTGLTLDMGCGEGRLPRDLKRLGYDVVGIDASATLIDHARAADPEGDYRIANAASVPLPDGSVTLVIAFMSLHDMDDPDAALAEAVRVLLPDGRLCLAIVHPINSAGRFEEPDSAAPFVIRESYFEPRVRTDVVERDGLPMTFRGWHRPLEGWFAALDKVGLIVERLGEVPDTTRPPGDRWSRVPLFLHVRARRA